MEKGLTVAQVYMAVASALTDTDSSLSLTLDGLDVSVSIQSPEESRMTREKLMDLEIDPSAMSAMSFFGSKCSFSATFAISGVKMPLRAASICVVYSIFCSFPNACFGTKEKGM